MAKKAKEYWYVIVMTKNGAVFVTGIQEHNMAEWNKTKPPRKFEKDYAKGVAFGLTVNGYLAYAVATSYELTSQPYRYEIGNFYWRRKKVKNDN